MITDLHTHTNASDSNLSREQLLLLAHSLGVDRVAITDHDTMFNSYRGEGDPVDVIIGCELSTFDVQSGCRVHLLCYEPVDRSALDEHFAQMRLQRIRAADGMIEKIGRLYPVVSQSSVARYRTPEGNLFKQGIMSVLCEYGYAGELFGDLYKQLLGSGTGSCRVPLKYEDATNMARIARESGATVVLAHPSVYHNMPVAYRLCSMKLLDGIEIEHPRNTQADKQALRELCSQHSLLMTGGSDYHGLNNRLGMQMGKYLTDDDTCDRILHRAKNKQGETNS